MFLFTVYIQDEYMKFAIGFSMVSVIGLFLFINLGFVFFFGFKDLYLLGKKYKNRFMHYFFPPLQEETVSESEDKEEAKSEDKDE